MKTLGDLWHAIKGFDEDTRYNLEYLGRYVTADEKKLAEYLVKYRKVSVDDMRFPASERVLPEMHYPVLVPKSLDAEQAAAVKAINARVADALRKERFTEFSKKARAYLVSALAPHIIGLDEVKEAVVLQLVMPERFHILLLGDPGTGKTDVLRAAVDFSSVSSFGLGSGASKAGLAAVAVGKEIHKGLLPQADGGLCCIDELNLMKAEDRAALYNAMEKGFVTYDKGALHERFSADIRLLATANPRGDQFHTAELAALKKQLPFDAALLSRFHLLFIVRKPNTKAFREIAKHSLASQPKPLSTEDLAFIHDYLGSCRSLDVKLSAELSETIVDAASAYKEREKHLLIDVTPRLAKGMVSLAKALARLEMRAEATSADVQRSLAITSKAFTIT